MDEKTRGMDLRQTVGATIQFAGLWMLVMNAAVLVVAALSFFHLLYLAGDVSNRERTLILEAALTVLCVVALGLATARRLAGPWVILRRVCDTVHAGDLGARLLFPPSEAATVRAAAEAFNQMLDCLEERLREAEGAAPLVSDAPLTKATLAFPLISDATERVG